ncbi:DUF3574 domain-containing protein [Tolypothrix campylonemoides VB511288]|nr:DUF3574 domain-containing protein [Tolypothrix campylonemoides VB511288]
MNSINSSMSTTMHPISTLRNSVYQQLRFFTNPQRIAIIYENNLSKNHMIEQVIASYKQTFQQESVLRVTSTVKLSF